MMKLQKLEEMRDLSRRLNTQGAEPHGRTGELTARYLHLAEVLGVLPALNDAVVEQKQLLMAAGRYYEVLQLLEDRVQQNPCDMRAQEIWRFGVSEVHQFMLGLARSAPETAEYGRTYERLVSIGSVGSDLHIGAIRHYLSCGRLDRALELLLALARVAPRTPGVVAAALNLARLSDDARVRQLFTLLKLEEK